MNASLRFGLVGLTLLATLTGCPQVPPADPLATPPLVTAFTASAQQVTAGGTVTLTWAADNATSVRIDELSLGQVSGVSGNSGTVDVSVGADSTYVLTVRNDRGAADTAVVSVRVSGTARELLLAALPETIESGRSATIAWSAPGAGSVTLTADPGGAIDLQGQTAAGSVIVSPTESTTYTLSADGRTRAATLNVTPTISTLSATAEAVDGGTNIRVSWATVGATRVQLSGAARGSLVDLTDATQVAGGEFIDAMPSEVDPGQYFSYTLTASGTGGSSSREVIFGVPGNPAIISFTAPPAVKATDGGTITLAWQTTQAEELSLSADGIEFYRAAPASVSTGTLQLPTPAADVTYTLSARTTRGGEATKTATVDVVGVPTVALMADMTTVAAGQPLTLSWAGTSIRNVVIREVGFGDVFALSPATDTGTATLAPSNNATYLIDVDNGLGDHATAMVSVTVSNPIALTISETGTLRAGQDITVSWVAPAGATDVVGLAHQQVDTRTASTGFDDIRSTGTPLTFASAASPASIVTGFRMPYFGRVVGSTITVSRHGYLGFGRVNGENSADTALPTGLLEDGVVAPYWESLTIGAGVHWQLKSVGGGDVLIVQWTMSTATFQAKLHANGQVDFEYLTLPSTPAGRSGLTGWVREQTLIAPSIPTANTGFTFFGPRPSPLTMKVFATGSLLGNLILSTGASLRLTTPVEVVRPLELVLNEAMAVSPVGTAGQWVELRNTRATPIDLTGWSFGLADGGAAALSGTVPANGLLVVGASVDPLLNDDADVQVAVTDFDLTGLTNLALQRAGTYASATLSTTSGTASVFDPGPYVGSTAAGDGPKTCAATQSYGALGQFGSPGVNTGCTFPYTLASLAPGFFDISTTGTALTAASFDELLFTVDLSTAPVPFFGTPRTSVVVSTNGFIVFETATASTFSYLAARPSTSGNNGVVAAFAQDLTGVSGTSNIYRQRVGSGVDPSAPNPHWIIQWSHYRVWRSPQTTDDFNFQIKLFDDGTIEVHFADMISSDSFQAGSGIGSSTWLENPAGTEALVVNARSATPGIQPHSAFRFSPR